MTFDSKINSAFGPISVAVTSNRAKYCQFADECSNLQSEGMKNKEKNNLKQRFYCNLQSVYKFHLFYSKIFYRNILNSPNFQYVLAILRQ